RVAALPGADVRQRHRTGEDARRRRQRLARADRAGDRRQAGRRRGRRVGGDREDRKSTRLNSSHSQISYAVFCLKKKKKKTKEKTNKNTKQKKKILQNKQTLT